QQAVALTAAGCALVHRETASGASRARPVLNKLLGALGRGDVLVVVRIDRLARSLRHLLDVIETLEARGAGFRSLSDPIDTTTPQGRFALQILGAVAEFERALISERTRAGLERARAEGRQPGNPGLRAGDPAAALAISRARNRSWLDQLRGSEDVWLPVVQTHRPDVAWADLAMRLNGKDGAARRWTAQALRRAARAYVDIGRLDENVLDRAPRSDGVVRRDGGASDQAVVTAVAALMRDDPSLTLAELGRRLLSRKIYPARGRKDWAISTLRLIRIAARERGLF
ncbi:recombinase family protein, partial [Rubrimonas cliftonensis]